MRLKTQSICIALLLPLAACGGAEKSSNSVQMKDMEVVDGTASDAMTDLDGVQSEGTPLALPSANAAANASVAAKPAEPVAKTEAQDDEVLADQ